MTITNNHMKAAYEAATAIVTGIDAANEVYAEAMKEFHGNYTGALLADKLNEAQKAQQAQIQALKDEHSPKMREAVDKARTAVAEAAAKPIPSDVSAMLRDVDGLALGEHEKAAIVKLASSNYLAKIKADAVLGTVTVTADGIPTLDNVYTCLDQLQTIHERAVSGSLGEYMTKMLVAGNYHAAASEAVEGFLGSYA